MRIAKTINVFERRLAAVEGQPALQRTPEQYATTIQRAGEGAITSAVRQLDQDTGETQKITRSRRGDRSDAGTGLAAAVIAFGVGWIGGPYFDGALLPQRWEENIASITMNTTRWKAGTALVQASHPKAWARFVSDWTLATDNKTSNAAVAACRAEVAKLHKAQDCRITVSAGT